MNYTYYKKFVENGSYVDSKLEKMSDRYSEQYNAAISPFDIVINSDRADTIYKYQDTTPYLALVDFNVKSNNSSVVSNKKEVRTKHSDNFKHGDIIDIENKISKERQTYLLTKSVETKEGYDLSVAELCNSTFKLSGTETKVLKGYDYLNRPIYETTTTGDQYIPCIVESRIFNATGEDEAINLPENKIQVTMQYTEHKDIDFGKDFQMYGQPYRITGLDYTQVMNNKGILKIIGEREG